MRTKQNEKTQMMDIIAGMKDPVKGPVGDMFVENYGADIRRFLEQAGISPNKPFADAIPELSDEQIGELQRPTDACCNSLRKFVVWVKERHDNA